MSDLINISVGNAAITALMGYAVVFLGLVLLMIVVMILGSCMKKAAAPEAADKAAEAISIQPQHHPAPGSAGELKLYDTDPRDAAMIMAIVADSLGKPINELRFISIREVKE